MFHLRNARFSIFAIALVMIAAPFAARNMFAVSSDPRTHQEDLAAFERDFFAADHAYSPAARAEAERRIAALRRTAAAMSDAKFALALSQIVALADNGHTLMISLGSFPELAKVGIRLTPFGEDYFVVRAEPSHADLLGGRLVAIDGVPVARLRDSVRTLRGGIPAWRDRGASVLLESPGLLNAMGIARSAAQASYRFEMRDGKLRDATLTAIAGHSGSGHSAVVALSPADDGTGFATLLAPAHAPWSLQEFSQPFRRRDAPELDAEVIQLHMNVDAGTQSIAKFLQESDSLRIAAHRHNVILDMRFNGGGNLQLTREFFSALPRRIGADGRIVVLTSPWTFSAAISSVGYLKQAGGERVILVGEAPGDRLQFWAEGQPISLPHSGAMVLMATQRHDYLTGCKGFTDCHGAVVQFPIAVKSLAPDVAAPWTIESYAAGRDPGMEAAAKALRR